MSRPWDFGMGVDGGELSAWRSGDYWQMRRAIEQQVAKIHRGDVESDEPSTLGESAGSGRVWPARDVAIRADVNPSLIKALRTWRP